jgi:DNA-binding transcriptional ArsR family regulator
MHMDSLTSSFSALADPTRRAILSRLSRGEATVSQLVDQFDLSQPTISSHLKMLERAGLITRGRIGTTRPCRLEPKGLRSMADWLAEYERFWTGTIDSFVDFAEALHDMEASDDRDT